MNDDYGLKKQQLLNNREGQMFMSETSPIWNAGKLEEFTRKKVLLFRVYSHEAQIRFALLST